MTFETLEERIALSASTGQHVELDPFDFTAVPVVILADPIATSPHNDPMVLAALSAASNLDNYTPAELEDATHWVGYAQSNEAAAAVAVNKGISGLLEFDRVPGMFVYEAAGQTAAEVTATLDSIPEFDYFYPLVGKQLQSKALTNDPYLSEQWYLNNVGQLVSQPDDFMEFATTGKDIRVERAWDIATGQGVTVAIVDDGVQYSHPDLTSNYNRLIDFDLNGALGSGFRDQDPLPELLTDFHGTAVAGLIGAAGNNGEGITGVAYDSTITGIRLIAGNPTQLDVFDGLTHESQIIDIYNNSWGHPDPVSGIREIYALEPLEAQAFVDSAFLGRGGLGTVQIFAAGNGGLANDSSVFDGYAAHRYSIAVGAVDHEGFLTSYTEGGPNILLVAPSDDGPSGILTTDLVGDYGYNELGFLEDQSQIGGRRDFFDDLDYTSTFGGTSAAAPLVAGAAALLLEINPDLTSRDISEILARSARQDSEFSAFWIPNVDDLWIDPFEPGGPPEPWPMPGLFADPPFFDPAMGANRERLNYLAKNGAGYLVHDNTFAAFGQGVLDTALATQLAAEWQSSGSEAVLRTPTFLVTNEDFQIHPAEEVDVTDGPTFTVPGAWNGAGGGWAEFYKLWLEGLPEGEEEPDPFPMNTRPGKFEFFMPDTLSLENVDVTLRFDSAPVEAFEFLRITLVSPDGTQSDFNPYIVGGNIWDVQQVNPEGGFEISHTFNTTRHLGERTGGNFSEEFIPDSGIWIDKPWTLEFTNWGEESLHVQEFQFSFYGTPAAPARIQGSVGLDTNGDGDFNHTNLVDDENFEPIRDLVAERDKVFVPVVQAESWAAGAVVYLDLDLDGERDESEPRQVVGADGNYYFDVPFGTYRVVVEPPVGTVPVGPISMDVQVGPDDGATPEKESRGLEKNFTLRPLDVVIQGTVVADLDGDGTQDFLEPFAHSRLVFVDLNEDGQLNFRDENSNIRFDFGIDTPFEPIAQTGLDGSYMITLSPGDIGFSGTDYYTVILLEQSGWTTTSPVPPVVNQFITAGEPVTIDYLSQPELASISGLVYNDVDGNGTRNGTESGLAGFIVLLDENDNGIFDAGENVIRTDSTGFYSFFDLLPLSYTVRVLARFGYQVTQPMTDNGTYPVLLGGGQSAVGRDFGLTMTSDTDFDGDGDTDGDDFLRWQAGFGTAAGATNEMGDADLDGDVDGDDFLLWQAAYGLVSGGGGSAPSGVPAGIGTPGGFQAAAFIESEFNTVRLVDSNVAQFRPRFASGSIDLVGTPRIVAESAAAQQPIVVAAALKSAPRSELSLRGSVTPVISALKMDAAIASLDLATGLAAQTLAESDPVDEVAQETPLRQSAASGREAAFARFESVLRRPQQRDAELDEAREGKSPLATQPFALKSNLLGRRLKRR